MISIIIPAYNEEKNIEASVTNTIKAAKAAGNVPLDIIVVNDASTDRTKSIITKLEGKYPVVRSIHHDKNKGIGESFKEALAIATYPKFMIVPGDNDASPMLLEQLFKEYNKAEMILSYYINKEDRGRFRNFLSTLYGIIYMLIFDVYVQYLNGISIYPTEKLRKISINATRFSITAEVNIKLLRLGCTYHEVMGRMQTGILGSTSITLQNLIEIFKTFFYLVYEIKFSKRHLYNKKPKRIWQK